MPFALLILGILLLVAGVRDKQGDLFDLVKGDFTGPNNFVYWVLSILIIGAVGYIPKMKPISDGFLALVIIVLFLTRGNPVKNTGGGFFQQFTQGIASTNAAQPSGGTSVQQASALEPIQPLSGFIIQM